jgi:hypothetical protein
VGRRGELVQVDPPNALLAFLEPGDDMPKDFVIAIRNPRRYQFRPDLVFGLYEPGR